MDKQVVIEEHTPEWALQFKEKDSKQYKGVLTYGKHLFKLIETTS
ncbi:hypothetical protein [Bacillus pseudomycoides]|nr:hypothetical protein [Bacillus pseudomycoides]